MAQYNPQIHHRCSIRLKGYDYSQSGLYSITICVQDKLHLFGEIMDGKIILNDAGEMIVKWWHELNNKYKNIVLHEHVVMPNNFHGIIQIVGADLRICPNRNNQPDNSGQSHRIAPTGISGEKPGLSVSEMVQWFKTMTTNKYIRKLNRTIGYHSMVNCGNEIIGNTLFEMKKNIFEFLNISKIIL